MDTDISLARATPADSVSVFEWRNDEVTRAASVSQNLVPWEDHERWYASVLANSARYLYIARTQGDSAGVCRFDLDGSTAEISINLNPAFRGRGFAGRILRAAIDRFRQEAGPGIALTATIRPENTASIRTFTSLGFIPSTSEPLLDHYVLEQDGS